MAKMIKSGSVVGTPRLRGDTVGYLAELVQHYAADRLEKAHFFAWRSDRTMVTKDDIMVLDDIRGASLFASADRRCSVGKKCHNTVSSISCSCFISSSHGTQWCWPEDDCLTEEIMPAEIRRKIVRRLAYRAGIIQLTSDAFDLIAAEMFHLLGVLLVDAFEASMKMDYGMYVCEDFIKHVHRLTYGTPGDGLDMFSVPPPPMPIEDDNGDDNGYAFTVVPGQIKEAVKNRFGGQTMSDTTAIRTGTVLGEIWVPSSGITAEDEKEVEFRYYGKVVEVELPYSSEKSVAGTNDDENMDVDYVYESDGYDTELEYDHSDY